VRRRCLPLASCLEPRFCRERLSPAVAIRLFLLRRMTRGYHSSVTMRMRVGTNDLVLSVTVVANVSWNRAIPSAVLGHCAPAGLAQLWARRWENAPGTSVWPVFIVRWPPFGRHIYSPPTHSCVQQKARLEHPDLRLPLQGIGSRFAWITRLPEIVCVSGALGA